MKNMKIGTKILSGFSIIIIMIIIITCVVVASSSTIANSTAKVGIYNEISDAVHETLKAFNSTRLDATRFSLHYSVDTWNNYTSNYNRTITESSKATNIISGNPLLAEHSASWNQIVRLLNDYNSAMQLGNSALIQANSVMDSLTLIGPEIVVAVSTMFDAQMNTTRGQIDNGDPPEELNIKMDRINDTVQINNRVTAMRVNVARLAENYSTERVPTVKDDIAAVRSTLDDYMGILRTQTSLAIAQNAVEQLDAYESAVIDFIEEQEQVLLQFALAARLGGETLNNLNERTDAFEESLGAAISAAESASKTARLVVLIVSTIAVAVSITIAIYIKNAITKPVLFISDIASKIAEDGDLELSTNESESLRMYSSGKDETAQTVANFSKLIDRLKTIDDCLSHIAANDLTASIKPLGNKDAMGLALQSMLITLNEMFSDINASSAQVSTGSKQVAEGAQALAQGATEQASSIQELASSISEIANSTRENATLAIDAAKLAGKIIGSAEKGSQQMDDMMAAVNEINEASNSIGKVIKVIDDIAFQTNILALNAAVEAARAGQHGKGFAVVAEEVRSLAAKSAEAAKDTGSLIESSMEKALLGVRIAAETAESLSEIVSGIRESNQLVDKIAESSEQQSLGIEQINIGVDQVAQVVSQNSATAQQSAAASQQMSSQSAMLQELISQFKLLDGSTGVRSLFSPLNGATGQRSLPPNSDTQEPAEGDDFGKY